VDPKRNEIDGLVRRRSVGLRRGDRLVLRLEQLLGILEKRLGVEILVFLDRIVL
jgi:hypothetical protein